MIKRSINSVYKPGINQSNIGAKTPIICPINYQRTSPIFPTQGHMDTINTKQFIDIKVINQDQMSQKPTVTMTKKSSHITVKTHLVKV